MDCDTIPEYVLRLWKLMEPPRSLSLNAAKAVVNAAMYGVGCIEGKVREEQQRVEENARRDLR